MRRKMSRAARSTRVGRAALRIRAATLKRVQQRGMARRLVRGGLVDQPWYEAQTAVSFDSPLMAAQHYLAQGRLAGFSINPLLEPSILRPRHWRTSRIDPAITYLTDPPGQAVPHLVFSEKDYLGANPDSADHPGRGVGHFLERATDSTLLPVRPGAFDADLAWGPWRTRMLASAAAWADRRRLTVPRVSADWDTATESAFISQWSARPAPVPAPGPLVSIVMPVRNRPELVRLAIESVQAQTLGSWELLVVDDGSTDSTPEVVDALAQADPRIRLVRRDHEGVCAARNTAIAEARGHYVTFLDSDNTWRPRFLELSTSALHGLGARAGYSAIEILKDGETTYRGFEGGRPFLMVGNHIALIVLLVERELLAEVGGFDPSLRRWVDHDLVLRISEHADLVYLPFRGAVVDEDADHTDRITTTEGAGWGQVVLQKHHIDWDAQRDALPERVASRTSMLIPTYHDWSMTVDAVRAVLAATPDLDLEVVVLDNGSGRIVSSMLEAVLGDLDQVRIISQPRNTQFAMGSNLAFAESSGARVVFLNNDTLVRPGWLQPLLEELEDPHVLAAQPLLTYADGTIQCAGVWFPGHGGLPSHFLAHHPAEDATRLGRFEARALTGAALAMRADDVVQMRGFDPMFINGWEDIDLCFRLAQAHPGSVFRVVTDSRVEHLESKSTGRGLFRLENRRIFLDRWREQLEGDDNALIEAAGFELVGLDAQGDESVDGSVVKLPVIARRVPVSTSSVPHLRWAIRIASGPGPKGDTWGDTFFAADLAAALRRLGQDVVVDRRESYDRRTSHLDDVTLTIRGLVDVVPSPDHLNLLWVISHPDLVTADEVRRYDAAFAASAPWARWMAGQAGVPVEPLLQATDPARFHPMPEAPRGDDVLFVGNFRPLRPVVADALSAGLDLAVYGSGWRETDAGPHVHGDYLPNDRLGTAYATAGVVLCDHWVDMAREGFVANRLFDAVACGARVVSDPVEGLEEVFGPLVRVYSDAADLAEVVGPGRDESFLPDDARIEAARIFAAENSFDARAKVLLDRVVDLRLSRGSA